MRTSRKLLMGVLGGGGGGIRYLLRDDFTADLAAGSVNATAATPGPGTRTVNDTANHLSVSGGEAVTDGNGVTNGDPRLVYADIPITRAWGRLFVGRVRQIATDAAATTLGFMNTATPGSTGSAEAAFTLSGYTPISQFGTGTLAQYVCKTEIKHQAALLRNTGLMHFALLDGYWRLLYINSGKNTATVYPGYSHSHVGGTKGISGIRIPEELYKPAPIISDSFNRADGALGNTDGAGFSDQPGGGGFAWTSRVGTVAIAGNTAGASATAGGFAVATVPASKQDLFISATMTKGTTGAGIVVRYVDADNFVYVTHDGTTFKLIKRVGGVETLVTSAAKTLVASVNIQILIRENYFQATYNEVGNSINAAITDPVLQTGTMIGLWFGDTDSRIDNFHAWPEGGGDEWTALRKYHPAQTWTPGRVLLTCDDGLDTNYPDDYQYMFDRGVKMTWYQATGIVGTEGFLTWDQLRALDATGMVDICNHTRNHIPLATLSLAEQTAELTNGYNDLVAEGLGRTARHVSYPNGSDNADTLTAMTAAGMLTGRDSNGVSLQSYTPTNIYLLNCHQISNTSTVAEVETRIYDAIDRGQVCSLLFHKIVDGDEDPLPGIDWPRSRFRALIDFIYARNIPTVTISELYPMLTA